MRRLATWSRPCRLGESSWWLCCCLLGWCRVRSGEREEELFEAAGVGVAQLGEKHLLLERDARHRLCGHGTADHVDDKRPVRAGDVVHTGGSEGDGERVRVGRADQ